jgi:hypothetical protein
MNSKAGSKRILIAIFTVFLSTNTFAAFINTLYGTGLNVYHNALVNSSTDLHYFVKETGAAAQLASNTSQYYPNDNNSQWIWENSNGLPVNVTRSFVTTFDLSDFDYTTAVINGAWGTDNQGVDILVNGTSTGITLPGVLYPNFQQMNNFTISEGFQHGINTLEFVIKDDGVISAFRAQLAGSADIQNVPEPSLFLLFSTGFLSLTFFRIKKIRRYKQLV